ncbi:TetR/AcrR family transcriptional regulator [Leptospira ognonensis]|uniref:TetR/AcrR family transcriptional regulator n=1 Tax=Leptospira ognonensis TaxID=2484945 RepID=A0A4R9JXM0_9LEPT|nr:TetR/AcrR family transcriptional regulator [Leptospira ognonensis]TGL57957.1 TetR/AcrR family transcriptional regulator [Leptospira ognonensis]
MAKKIKFKHGRPNKNSRILNRETILEASFALANQIGYENLSMKLIADQLEIRPPSLYNHIDDIAVVKIEIAGMALKKLASHLKEAVEEKTKTTEDKQKIFRMLIFAYREFAKSNRGVYAAVLPSAEKHDVQMEASKEIISICMQTMDLGPVLDSSGVHKIRILRASLHGFVSLEAAEGFGLPESVEETFSILTDQLIKMLLPEKPTNTTSK